MIQGLLLKDFCVLTRQMRYFLLMIVLFAAIPSSNMALFAVIYAAMLPYTALAYDERSKWDQLAGMMPYSKRDLVLSKYLLGWIFAVGAAAVALLAGFIEQHFLPQTTEPLAIVLSLFVAIIIIDITLPPMFRFGVEKGRMFFIILVVAAACGSAGLVSGIVEDPGSAALVPLLDLILPLAAVILTFVSVFLSIHLYGRRDF